MSKFMTDVFFLIMLFLIGIGVVTNVSSSNDIGVSGSVEDFDQDVSNGDTIQDGYLDGIHGAEQYEGNGVAKTVEKIGKFIVNGTDKIIEIILDGVKGLLD